MQKGGGNVLSDRPTRWLITETARATGRKNDVVRDGGVASAYGVSGASLDRSRSRLSGSACALWIIASLEYSESMLRSL